MVAKRTVHLVGANVLVEELEGDEKSSGGIIIPDKSAKSDLLLGRVVQKGPGFLIPATEKAEKDDLHAILNGKSEERPIFIPLDLQEGDVVYFPKEVGDEIFLDGKSYKVVPYPAMRLFIREEE